MEKLENNWHNIEQINDISQKLEISMISVWIITEDNKVVLISEDGLVWHFPGGKPRIGEELLETLYREVKEETGLDISLFDNRITPFGYTVEDEMENRINLKFYLPLPEVKGWKLLMSSEKELDNSSKGFCTAVDFDEIKLLLKDLRDSGEIKAVKRLMKLR